MASKCLTAMGISYLIELKPKSKAVFRMKDWITQYRIRKSVESSAEIESCIPDEGLDNAISNQEIGRIIQLSDAEDRYLDFLRQCWPKKHDLGGLKLVIDCANGATYRIAPILFESLGAEVTSLFIHPDGKNINADCGSEHTRTLAQKVVETGADLGVAFDGDGDRLALVDETGHSLTGDQVLASLANHLKSQGQLRNNLVVNTVMSNLGLTMALDRMGIGHETADVGDRRVMEKMRANGAVLGGEDSGHIIFLDQHTTGDGLLSALRLMEVMVTQKKPLSKLSHIMTVAPQALINVSVSSKPDLDEVEPIKKIILQVKSDLNGQGRVLVRYSGTQPMCRVMVEGPNSEITERYCRKIADVVSNTIGGTS